MPDVLALPSKALLRAGGSGCVLAHAILRRLCALGPIVDVLGRSWPSDRRRPGLWRVTSALLVLLSLGGCGVAPGATQNRPENPLNKSVGAARNAAQSEAMPVAAKTSSSQPYLLVLGTSQDAGLPQIGCTGEHCERARNDPRFRRWASSLMLCDPASRGRWLLDASPDIREQLHFAKHHPAGRRLPGRRPALVEGIFLSHAHIGHYAGLMFLGRESYGAKNVPVYGTKRLRAFLRNHGPWSQLVALGNVRLLPLEPDGKETLNARLSVRALAVPHRDEFSDTVAFVIQGPRRSVLYLPDIDKWSRWQRSVEDVLAEVDVAFLDGTFFDDKEIPGRAMSEIPHPFIRESLKRFGALPQAQRQKIIFTHLNHSNPAQIPSSAAAAAIRAQGMRVAKRGMRIEL